MLAAGGAGPPGGGPAGGLGPGIGLPADAESDDDYD